MIRVGARRSIAVINPNSTEAMTAQMARTLTRVLGDAVTVLALTNTAGPPAIQGVEDARACLPGLRASFEAALAQGADAVIVGCFDDTGLAELRGLGRAPVIGLGEAGYLAASLAAPHFVVVTTLEVAVPVITANIAQAGLAARCRAVLASGVPVLDLGPRTDRVDAAIVEAQAAHPGSAVVLGCGGMTAILPGLRACDARGLIDPVAASARMAQAALAL